MVYLMNCAGFPVKYSFQYPSTFGYFKEYIEKVAEESYDIQICKDDIIDNIYKVKRTQSLAFTEFQHLMLKTGNFLLMNDRCLFHGVVFIWKNFAWLFTASSGTGKTTQYRLWKEIEKDIQIINGDKPILEYRNGTIFAHSSPWKGKEGFGTYGLNAPLAGIILLEQDSYNNIELIEPSDSVLPLFLQFISYPDNPELIVKQSEFLDHMLNSLPVWKLQNKGDIDSALLTRSVLNEYLEELSCEV